LPPEGGHFTQQDFTAPVTGAGEEDFFFPQVLQSADWQPAAESQQDLASQQSAAQQSAVLQQAPPREATG